MGRTHTDNARGGEALREVERHTTPAAAEIEDRLPRAFSQDTIRLQKGSSPSKLKNSVSNTGGRARVASILNVFGSLRFARPTLHCQLLTTV